MLPKYGENIGVKQLGSGWDDELRGVSSGSKLFAYGTIVVNGRLRINTIFRKLARIQREKLVRTGRPGTGHCWRPDCPFHCADTCWNIGLAASRIFLLWLVNWTTVTEINWEPTNHIAQFVCVCLCAPTLPWPVLHGAALLVRRAPKRLSTSD